MPSGQQTSVFVHCGFVSSVQESFTELALLLSAEEALDSPDEAMALLKIDDCKELFDDETALLTREDAFELFTEEVTLLFREETRELRAEEAHGHTRENLKSGSNIPLTGSTVILMTCGPGLTSASPQFHTSGGLLKQEKSFVLKLIFMGSGNPPGFVIAIVPRAAPASRALTLQPAWGALKLMLPVRRPQVISP